MNTAIGGHYSEDEDKSAFMGYIHDLADYAAERDVVSGPGGSWRYHGLRCLIHSAHQRDRSGQCAY